MKRLTFAVLAFGLLVGSGSAAQQPPAECGDIGDVQFVCGQQAPEDLVVVPGEQWVVASAYGGSGGLYLIRVRDRMSTRVYPGAAVREVLDAKAYPTCPGAPNEATQAKFQTHGLSIREGRNGVHTLLVVLHGGRESVEVFTIDTKPATPVVTWIGCAVAPDPIGLNSVRWLDDGGFIATNFLPRGDAGGMKRMQSGERNGELWEWHAATGWQKVPDSDASGANGLEISEDGRTLYVAAWGSQSFFRLSRGGRESQRQEVPLGFRVDNIRWARDGSLLATGQAGAGPQMQTVIVKIDPRSLAISELLRRSPVGRFTAGTVAVEVGNQIWVGSYIGDRLAIFPVSR